MTEERLQLLPEDFLREIAVKEGISINENIDKQDLIDLILEAIEEDRAENVMANNPAMQIKERKFDITLNEQFDFDEDQYPLPESYNETKIVMLLRDPAWAYTYWDIKDSEIASLKFGNLSGKLNLRVYEMGKAEFSKANIQDFFDIPVQIEDGSWYINLPRTGIYYCVELILKGSESEKVLCRSNFVKSPQWEVGELDLHKDLKGSGNDLLLVAGVYDLSAAEAAGKIPQRIISMIDSEFLE
ncbi:MAG: DUF4912 domain-containing protein [Spirochaetales bacterium]|uniref:DUF4912 domain-containing protein n=1 Tax=Candidatus Thalassospirochaeta sargassi TaxID=3119039 RepID=A0AAJ1IFV3_9SPIO|nr:DUF4912 domain-containing protein [Spirochaetales bacterium]